MPVATTPRPRRRRARVALAGLLTLTAAFATATSSLTTAARPATFDMVVRADEAPAGINVNAPVEAATITARASAGARSATVTATAADFGARTSGACVDDGVSGNRVQVLYVVPRNRSDRYSQVVNALRTFTLRVDDTFVASALKTGGSRQVRWVHDGTCMPTITHVASPYTGTADSFDLTMSHLKALGYNRPDRKYLVYMDASTQCGIANLYADPTPGQDNYNNGQTPQFARVDVPCWGVTGSHSVEAHELMHTLGAVQVVAPNSNGNGHCTDEYDPLCYQDESGVPVREVCPADQESLFDCNNDDYFSTRPEPGSPLSTHWNTADSSFLLTPAAPRPAPVSSYVPGLASTLAFTNGITSGQGWRAEWAADPGCVLDRSRALSTDVDATTAELHCPAGTSAPAAARVTQQDQQRSDVVFAAESAPRGTTTTVSASDPTPVRGAQVTYTAQVVDTASTSGVWGVDVAFTETTSEGTRILGTATTQQNGIAALTTTAPAKTGTVAAAAAAVGPFTASSGTTSVTVEPATTTLALTAPSSVAEGDQVTLAATLATADAGPVPGADVVLCVDGTPVQGATTDAAGRATFAVVADADVTYQVRYAGNDDYKASASTSATITVNYATTLAVVDAPQRIQADDEVRATVSLGTSRGPAVGATVELRTGSATGEVVATASTDATGRATFSTFPQARTTYVATFAAQAGLQASVSQPFTVDVVARATTLTLTGPAQASAGTRIGLAGVASDTSTGQVVPGAVVLVEVHRAGSWTALGTVATDATGRYTIATTLEGIAHTYRATTAGTARRAAASSPVVDVAVVKVATRIEATGTTPVAGGYISLNVLLTDVAGTPLPNQYVRITGTGINTGGWTNGDGVVALLVKAPAFSTTATLTYAGTTSYAGSKAAVRLTRTMGGPTLG